jgi:long-chain fatty acid transport protein
MMLLSRHLRGLCAISLILIPFSAYATNGYFLIGYGAKSRGMGGVGVAYGQDAMAAGFNPASMADVNVDTMRVDIGMEYFHPKRAVNTNSAALENGFPGSSKPVNHESGSNDFLIPSGGFVYKFNRKITMGFAAVGAGANTRYKQNVPTKPACQNGDTSDGVGSTFYNFNCNADSTTVGVNLIQLQMLPSVAYNVTKTQTLGASLAIAAQSFRAYGLGAFQDLGFAGSDKNVSGEGNDFSYGAGVRFGWMGKFLNERLTLGANYSSRVYMTRFDKYKNLFAEHGKFDIPENYALGMALKLTDKLTLAADVQKINYNSIRSVANTGPSVSDPGDLNTNGSCKGVPDDVDPDNCKLGGDDGMGFGWNDAIAYKIGINYDYNKNWSFRTGYNYGKSPIQDKQVLFNMLAPATVQHHVTVGASYRPNKNMEWSVNYMHAFSNTIKGPTAFGPTGDPDVDKHIDSTAVKLKIDSIGIGFAYKM